jgi:hypothetical protein
MLVSAVRVALRHAEQDAEQVGAGKHQTRQVERGRWAQLLVSRVAVDGSKTGPIGTASWRGWLLAQLAVLRAECLELLDDALAGVFLQEVGDVGVDHRLGACGVPPAGTLTGTAADWRPGGKHEQATHTGQQSSVRGRLGLALRTGGEPLVDRGT